MSERAPEPSTPRQVTVLKLNPAGEVVWRYSGWLLELHAGRVVLEAIYDLRDMPLLDVVLKRGDRFVETFYTDRWYNVFEVFDRDDGMRKGWYCNVSKPATIADDRISWVDLALDLWVSADGTQTVMDEDEFQQLDLDDDTVAHARAGLEELRKAFDLQVPR